MAAEKHALVALGANLNFGTFPPKAIIEKALACFALEGLELSAVSRLYETPCFPAGAGPDYVNAAAIVTLRHDQTPEQILAALHKIEHDFGRSRSSRWAGRSLDLDLLAVRSVVAPDLATYQRWQTLAPADQAQLAPAQLILPHPRLQDRAFVLVPLAEIAAEWRHPVSGQTVMQMLQALPAADRDAVRVLPQDDAF